MLTFNLLELDVQSVQYTYKLFKAYFIPNYILVHPNQHLNDLESFHMIIIIIVIK